MGKVALITGASCGIGRQMARDFAAQGYGVAIGYLRHKQEALALQAELGPSALAVQADLADAKAIAAMVQKVTAHFGNIDVLINNAGISSFGLLTEISEKDWLRLFDINVHGAYRCIREVLPKMISRGRGVILNISSIWGVTGASCEVCYSATKAALIGLTKALAKEVGPSGVRVNCIAPGVIETDMNAHLSAGDLSALAEETPLGRIGTPVDVSAAALFLASPGASFITGQVLGANGGIVI